MSRRLEIGKYLVTRSIIIYLFSYYNDQSPRFFEVKLILVLSRRLEIGKYLVTQSIMIYLFSYYNGQSSGLGRKGDSKISRREFT